MTLADLHQSEDLGYGLAGIRSCAAARRRSPSPRRSYRAVVTASACSASRCTVNTSTPALSSSDLTAPSASAPTTIW